MKLSRKWLQEFVDIGPVNDRDFAEAMTLSGSKVEVTEDLGAEISNVVAGRIKKMERHPDSDHMWVCQVDIGEKEPVQIVTGAWNIHTGDLVPVAKHNSTLPGGKKITRGKLRGVLSDGMMCGLSELGLDERDFPYAVIEAAALLNDYKPIEPEKPSIPADIQPGHKIFGPVVCARVETVMDNGGGHWTFALDWGESSGNVHNVRLQNIHQGDLVAYNTKSQSICTLADLHAEQKEFPHCIPDGIFVMHEKCRPGDDIKPIIGADDHVVEFEITPNRPDCLSVIGLAREAAATFDKPLKLHTPVVKGCPEDADNPLAQSIAERLDVETPDPDLCPRYTARMVRNVKIAPSPKWMRERLRSMGVRPINNIVDITNYVMLEYGQPMHAFDYRYVKGGKIVVRRAQEGEELTTLDGSIRKLNADMLVIADDTRAVGLAGVMGGLNSEIVEDTADVVFESANFDGACIRKTALALGMRTEASAKFEKGLDILNTLPAVNRACELVELLGAGEVVDGVIDILNYVPQPTVLKVEPDKINALLGTDVAENVMYTTLQKLGFETTKDRGMMKVPSWRSDVEGMADLAEEVARFYGYNKIPDTLSSGLNERRGWNFVQRAENAAGALCRAAGYSEIITYSFISPTYYDKIDLPANSLLRNSMKILNPLGEDTSIMRTTTLPSMLEILARNYNYRNKSVRLYELGRTYFPKNDGSGMADEPKVLSLGAYGGGMDFFTLKGTVEAVLEGLRIAGVRYETERENPSYHPGRCARVYSGETLLGVLGQIHPHVADNYGADCELYTAELQFDALYQCAGGKPLYRPLPKFPAVTRDIALLCSRSIPVAALEDCIRRGAKGLLKNVTLFDIYTGPGVPEDKKSAAFSLELRADDRSLTAEEADEDVKSILELLKTELEAVLR
ncbi:phenylalanine--tRNA ligase subunit beta [Oscillibacter sp. 1-3]|uniref:phenylalanine--tRNA ligase subunit beta n=1 Tax=Oscillibacter sp. 1-3 TaxID=1235797 RepID=UPI000336600F|nr:phenylalanine--tRNA ligase subunit beta [Oscillibacter sp. 1-3]EOS63570.1 phenylalanine-tRNA ligase, beta subunit [Oscillibacter sp. 1-3]